MKNGKITSYPLPITHYALPITIVLVLSGCAASTTNHDHWFGEDKLYHFAAAASIGAGSSAVARDRGASRSEASIVGVSIAITAGVAKELYDEYVKRTYWSWKDMFWDAVGGIVGGLGGARAR